MLHKLFSFGMCSIFWASMAMASVDVSLNAPETITTDDFLTVDLKVYGTGNIAGAQFNIHFDSNLVRLKQVNGKSGMMTNALEQANELGKVSLTYLDASGNGLDSSTQTVLASFEFKPLREGETQISIDNDALLSDADLNDITGQLSHKSIQINLGLQKINTQWQGQVSAEPDKTFQYTLKTSGPEMIAGATFLIHFDPNMLTLENIVSAQDTTTGNIQDANSNGNLLISWLEKTGNGVDANNIEFVTLSFKAHDRGTTELLVKSALIANTSMRDISGALTTQSIKIGQADIDQAPVISIQPNTPISNTAYQISIASTESWIEYQLDETEWQRYTTSVKISTKGVHTIKARVKKSDEEWINATPVTFTIDQTPPNPPLNLNSLPEQNTCGNNTVNIQWLAATDEQTSIAGYSVLIDNQPETTPDNLVDISGLSWSTDTLLPGKEYYFHIVSVDAAGNVSTPVHAGFFCVNQQYEIIALAGEHGQILPGGTQIVQKGATPTFLFKPDTGYTIDQVLIDNTPVSNNELEYTFSAIDSNHRIEVTFQYSGSSPPKNVTAISESTGVKLKWIDQTISKEVAGYQVYRSQFQEGPFLQIDPVILKMDTIVTDTWYQVFDTFDVRDIQPQMSYWYGVSAIMFDNSVTRLSDPVEGQAQVVSGGLFHLVPIQQELEMIAGDSILFDIHVIAEGNFQDSVKLTVSYPSSQPKPEGVYWELTKDTVTPLASVGLLIKTGIEMPLGNYDIDINAIGGDRSDQLRVHFSIVDKTNNFISAHINQKSVRLGEHVDINGHISVRKNEWIDIYGKIIPSQIDVSIDIIIHHNDQPFLEMKTKTDGDGKYLLPFSPDQVGEYEIYARYKNQRDEDVDSQPVVFSARKSNQSEIRCNTGIQEIVTGKVLTIYSHLSPTIENVDIQFQIKKPDSSLLSHECTTSAKGECQFNLTLSEAGIWEILALWEGNEDYEGQYSKPLYLYPGIETPRALIIAGGGFYNNALRETTIYLANRFYQLLINRRLNEDSIYYMSSVSNESNDRIDEMDPTEQKVADYLESLYENGAPYTVNEKAPLIIYMVDHGGKNHFKLNSNAFLYAENLDQYLDQLQEKTNCKVQVIIDACFSGSFMDDLLKSDSQDRIIMTATGENALAFYDQDGRESFSSHLFNWLIQGFSLGDSFSHALSKLRGKPYLYKNQIPTINDFYAASDTYLGGTFIPGVYAPVFLEHTPNQVLPDRHLTITETIEDDEDQITVWASILPPNHQVPTSDNPQWQLETINLPPKPDYPNVYETTYNCFYQKGDYVVTVYAEDSAGNVSSEEILLTVKENQLPPGWGDMDSNDTIDLKDAIIALQILTNMLPSKMNLENQPCFQKVPPEEVVYILQMMGDLDH
jgi:hypothetical protein